MTQKTVFLNDDFVTALRENNSLQDLQITDILKRAASNEDQSDAIIRVRKAIAMLSLAKRLINHDYPQIRTVTVEALEELDFPFQEVDIETPNLADPALSKGQFDLIARDSLMISLMSAYARAHAGTSTAAINQGKIFYAIRIIESMIEQHQHPHTIAPGSYKKDLIYKMQ